eukprot:3838438-Prymnesium_polylepis.1
MQIREPPPRPHLQKERCELTHHSTICSSRETRGVSKLACGMRGCFAQERDEVGTALTCTCHNACAPIGVDVCARE